MKVELLRTMGDDDVVADAARVSFDKSADTYSDEANAKLLKYLAEHGHSSPFRHCFAQFRITAPIFCARQLGKHQVGLSWNEISRRYVASEPEFYAPTEWREAAKDKKQGSGERHDRSLTWMEEYCEVVNDIVDLYEAMIEDGVCPEQARMILPQSMMTSWFWSGSLQAFAHMYNLRTKPDAQQETREIAVKMGELLQERFPNSWKELTNGK